jgi:chitinase
VRIPPFTARRGQRAAGQRRRSAIAIGVTGAMIGAVGLVVTTAATAPVASAATSGGIKVAYYDQWSIYQNAFYPKALDTEGIASKLNYLIYDFENIDPSNLT